MNRVSPLPPLESFGPLVLALVAAVAVDLLVAGTAGSILLLAIAAALLVLLIRTKPAGAAAEVDDPRVGRALLIAQLVPIALAFVVAGLFEEDLWIAVAAATFVLATIAARAAVAAWSNGR